MTFISRQLSRVVTRGSSSIQSTRAIGRLSPLPPGKVLQGIAAWGHRSPGDPVKEYEKPRFQTTTKGNHCRTPMDQIGFSGKLSGTPSRQLGNLNSKVKFSITHCGRRVTEKNFQFPLHKVSSAGSLPAHSQQDCPVAGSQINKPAQMHGNEAACSICLWPPRVAGGRD
jgi:hypothetical protein